MRVIYEANHNGPFEFETEFDFSKSEAENYMSIAEQAAKHYILSSNEVNNLEDVHISLYVSENTTLDFNVSPNVFCKARHSTWKLPSKFIRPDDNAIFSINTDGKSYTVDMLKKNFPDNLHFCYSYEELLNLGFIPKE